MEAFNETLVRLRKEAGFKSAYEFFYKNVGERSLGISYSQYINIEKGRSAPSPKVAIKIGQLLSLEQRQDKVRQFMSAYLKALFGPEPYELFVAPLLGIQSSASPLSPHQLAIHRSNEARRYNLSVAEAKTINQSPSYFWAFQVFVNSSEILSARDLAKILKLPEKEIQQVLDQYVKLKFIKAVKNLGYRNARVNAYYAFPIAQTDPGKPSEGLRAPLFWEKLPLEPNSQLMRTWLTMRAPQSQLMNYLHYLRLAVHVSDSYATVEKKPDSAFFVVEASVRRLFKF